jgi:hypothetical protein
VARRRLAVGVLALAAAVTSLGLTAAAGAEGRGRCDTAQLKGDFGFAGTGASVIPGRTGQFASGGTASFDGRGGVAGAVSESLDGTIEQGTRYDGTYELGPGCTGSVTVFVHHPTGGHFHHFDVVLVDGGDELALVDTDPGFVYAFSMKRR